MRMPDKDLRDRLLSTIDRVSAPPSHLAHVVRRARILRLRRYVGWVVASSIALVGVALPLVALLPIGQSPDQAVEPIQPADSQSEMIDIGGIRFAVPEGWDARVYRISGYPRPVIRVATFALPESDDIQASAARDSMATSDMLIALTEYINCPCPAFDDSRPLPLSLEPSDFQMPFATGDGIPPLRADVPESHAFARRTFELSLDAESRFLDLWVEFAQSPAPATGISDVNDLLASVVIGPWEEIPQPDGFCNDQITKDPDCPKTIWITEVLAAAGFDAIDDPEEQTLVGRGGGTSFFIWARDSADSLQGYAFPVHSIVDGVPVYRGGGPPGTLVWRAQGLDVRISPGPRGGDVVPNQQGLETLVRATFSVAYPLSE